MRIGGDITDAGAEYYLAVGRDMSGLDDGVVNFAIESVAHFLSHL